MSLTSPQASTDGRRDFDFLVGGWRLRNRRLVDPLDPECARRFIWKDVTEASARLEEAFSYDQGRRWQTNRVITLTREPEGRP